jgi:FtsZ-interacting cell division protein YlmF
LAAPAANPTAVIARRPPPELALVPSPLSLYLAHPERFNDLRHVADRLKGGSPVLLDLKDAESHLDRRARDFAQGLAAALGGTVGEAGHRLLVLAPPGVALTGVPEADAAPV